MRAIITFALIALTVQCAIAGQIKSRTIEGKVKNFGCGDNCYLTISTPYGGDILGLCVAPECGPWNFFSNIPQEYLGKKVAVTVDVGDRIDGSGDFVDRAIAFTSVIFLH
jgi:hypothetical protein